MRLNDDVRTNMEIAAGISSLWNKNDLLDLLQQKQLFYIRIDASKEALNSLQCQIASAKEI